MTMAAQSGVWFFDGRPAEGQRHQLEQGLRSLGLVEISTATDAGIAIAGGDDHLWTHESPVRQPLCSDASLVMTWDGRLDNRDDLRLRLEGRLAKDDSDAGIAMAVFERWGLEGLGSLVGDWSLVMWNRRTRTLRLARDYMGVRPLYYYVDHEQVMWSTSLGELSIRAGCIDALNEEFVARFMSLQFSTDVTPYRGIRGVPAATCVTLSGDHVEHRRRFWSLDPARIRYRHARGYEEHLRALWMEAVVSRLRTRGVVWAELSGGLDSSAVVCTADAVIRAGRVPATGLQPISHVTLDSPEGDERRFIAEVERKINRHSEIVGVERHDDETSEHWGWVTPLAPRGPQLASMTRGHRADGRLLLTGRVGDVTMGCVTDNSIAIFDDLADWRVDRALSKVRRWSRACRNPFIETLWVLAQRAMRGGIAGDDSTGAGANVLSWQLRRHALGHPEAQTNCGAIDVARREVARQLLSFASQGRLESWPERGGLSEAHPFAHRPLVEYMLSIPAEELSAPGNTRALMRRSLVGLMPDRVLRRTSKGYYPPSALRSTRRRVEALPPVEQLESVERGWIDPVKLRAAIQRLGVGETDASVQLLLRLEQWLASRHRRGPAVIPTGKEVTTNDVRIA
jgi:asparagine synthase (glutamine-hydrolysing)